MPFTWHNERVFQFMMDTRFFYENKSREYQAEI